MPMRRVGRWRCIKYVLNLCPWLGFLIAKYISWHTPPSFTFLPEQMRDFKVVIVRPLILHVLCCTQVSCFVLFCFARLLKYRVQLDWEILLYYTSLPRGNICACEMHWSPEFLFYVIIKYNWNLCTNEKLFIIKRQRYFLWKETNRLLPICLCGLLKSLNSHTWWPTHSLIPQLASPLKGHRGKAIWYIRLAQKSRPKYTSIIACNSDTVIGHNAQLPENYLPSVLSNA